MGPIQTPFGADTFVVIEKWESVDHLKAHGVAPHMKEYGAKVKDLMAGRVIHVLSPVYALAALERAGADIRLRVRVIRQRRGIGRGAGRCRGTATGKRGPQNAQPIAKPATIRAAAAKISSTAQKSPELVIPPASPAGSAHPPGGCPLHSRRESARCRCRRRRR
jgi:hypothetical protein